MSKNEWKESIVGEHIELVYGDGLPERKRKGGQYPVYGSNGIVGFHNQYLVAAPGIIIGRKGTVGRVALSRNNFWPIDTTYYVRLKGEGDIYFWYYFLQTLNLDQMNSHTAVPGLNKDNVYGVACKIPPLSTQKKIAKILGDLDEKIELNHQMNKTLESIAQAVFKKWFVDNEQILEWRNGKIEDVASIRRDTISPNNFSDELFDHYSIPAFDEGCLPKIEFGSQIQSNKALVPMNAVLLSRLNPRIHRVWFPNVSQSLRSICSTEFLVTIPNPGFSREYLYGLFCSRNFLDKFTALVTGTSGSHQRVKPDYLLKIEAPIPADNLIKKFTDITKPVFRKMLENLTEAYILVQLRDSLLRKLLSGEIRVFNK